MDAEYRFGRLVVQQATRRLLVDGHEAKIGARAFDLLLALIAHRDRLVSKDELLDLVWPRQAVEEGNLHVHISALRKLLGANAILTIPGRGYRFIADETPAPAKPQPQGVSGLRASKPGNLPATLPPLYGRDADLDELTSLAGAQRLVSIVGTGGIGKTCLARALAHRRRGGGEVAWLVELASVEKEELLLPAVARTLGHVLRPGEDAHASLAEALQDKPVLLVLDNCEHLIEAVAKFVGMILAAVPGLRIVATSQIALRTPGEWVYRLGPLAIPPVPDAATALDHGAVALFVVRAKAADRHFKFGDGNVDTIVDICSALDGNALAIELAASRTRLLGLSALRQGLDERLNLLSAGTRSADPRHQSLTAMLEWSYALLTTEEQRLLESLSLFTGGFSLEAACAGKAEGAADRFLVLDHLASLVEKSLVEVGSGEPPRYRLLETTRSFALARLKANGALAAAQCGHARAVLALLRSGGFERSPNDRAARFEPDLANLRAALSWAMGPQGDGALALELAAASDFVWHVLGINEEGARIFAALEPLMSSATPPEIAGRFWLSQSKIFPGSTRTAADLARKSADIFRSLGDRQALFDATMHAAAHCYFAGDGQGAESALSEAKSLMAPDWPLWTRVGFEIGSSATVYWTGDPAAARRALRQTLQLSLSGGESGHTELIEMMLLGCEVALRHGSEALAAGRDLLDRGERPLRGFNRAMTEMFVCAALLQLKRLDEAEALLRAALPRAKKALGSARTSLCYVAYLCALRGRYADALRLVGAVDGLCPPGAAVLAPPNRSCLEDAEAMAAGSVDAGECERLKAEGRKLAETEAVAMGLPTASGTIA